MKWDFFLLGLICCLHTSQSTDTRESRKLFGGYRITPRFCKPTRKSSPPITGPTICMFNHECLQRNGQVVGACMDGFLFGACCQLAAGTPGELVSVETNAVPNVDNKLSQHDFVVPVTQTLPNPGVLPTAQDNVMVQIQDLHPLFSTPGVTHTQAPDTIFISSVQNNISPSDFKVSTRPTVETRKTTVRIEDSTVPYSDTPTVHITINSPTSSYQKPLFRPRPTLSTSSQTVDTDKYVLVPTISRPNKPDVVNIGQLVNITTKKPPSTSYVFSTTIPPRRTTPLTTTLKYKTTKPTKKRITAKPSGYSTIANSPSAFITTKKPPSTSYVYSPIVTKRPGAPTTITSNIAGPSYSVTPSPIPSYSVTPESSYSVTPTSGLFPSIPSAAPTYIVLGGATENGLVTNNGLVTRHPAEPTYPSSLTSTYASPNRKPPINSVTINNHVTQNIYSTSERPQPTVLITPKPSSISSLQPADYNSVPVELETSGDELINFPPVRNPNLNISNPIVEDEEITTPAFVEDETLNQNLESFVNKIIQGLQEPFQGLKDVVYEKNTTVGTTTKKPTKKQGTTTKRPSSTSRTTTRRPVPTRRPATTTVSTRRPTTTRRPVKTTRRPTTTTTESFIEEDTATETGADLFRHECGIRPLLKTGRIVGGKGAMLGEFPWQVLVRESTWLGLVTKNKCGGVLISDKFVMTAAHCKPGYWASLVAVFGELDISGNFEKRKPITRNVKRVIVHRNYNAATFENDLALLELETPVQLDAHIIPICLPRDNEDFTGRTATVTGWGRLKYGGKVPSILQEVQVPIMENNHCQEMFRTAGHAKVIMESFLCAGYAHGQKDSCEGDSGGPLVLQRSDGRYQLAGTVSHGIKCAAPYLPGVYMRTQYYKPWIVAITGIDSN